MENNAIAPVIKDVEQFQTTLAPLVIKSAEDYASAGDTLKRVANKVRELEDKRMEMTRPLDTSKKLIMDEFKKLTAPLEAFINSSKKAMLDWNRAEQSRIAEEQRIAREKAEKEARERAAAEAKAREEAVAKARAEAEAVGIPEGFLDDEPAPAPQAVAPVEVPLPPVPDMKTKRGAVSTTTIKENWQYEIIDPDAVPRQYCEPSRDHIRQSILAGTREIPGIRIYDAGTVQIR